MPAQVARSCHAIAKRNLRPSFVHPHRPGFVQKVETITAPTPFLRRIHQAPLYWIAMHIPQLLHALLAGPNVEVVKARLPERRAQNSISKKATLARVRPLLLRQQSAGRALFQHLHHRRRSLHLRFDDGSRIVCIFDLPTNTGSGC
jgi:hypothetical protein